MNLPDAQPAQTNRSYPWHMWSELCLQRVRAAALHRLILILTSRMIKVLSSLLSMPRLIVIGRTATVIAFAVLTLHLSIATVIIAAFSFQHSSLQTWATTVLPQARGTVVALFAGFLFAGSALGTSAGGALGDSDQWTLLFAVTGLAALVLTLTIVVSRRVYAGPRAR